MTHIAEGAFAIASGTTYSVLEELRKQGVRNVNYVRGITYVSGELIVLYYTGANKVLADLLNWFDFQNRNNSLVHDLSNKHQHADLISGATCSGTDMDDNADSALFLSGTHGYVSLSSASAFLTQQGTICAWINSNQVGTTNQTIYEHVDRVADSCSVRLDSNQGNTLEFVFSNYDTDLGTGLGAFEISGATTLSANTWYHVAVTSDGSTIRLYVNGNEETVSIAGTNAGQWTGDLTISGTGLARNIGVHIISGTIANTQFFEGRITNLRVASFAMSADEIRALFDSGM